MQQAISPLLSSMITDLTSVGKISIKDFQSFPIMEGNFLNYMQTEAPTDMSFAEKTLSFSLPIQHSILSSFLSENIATAYSPLAEDAVPSSGIKTSEILQLYSIISQDPQLSEKFFLKEENGAENNILSLLSHQENVYSHFSSMTGESNLLPPESASLQMPLLSLGNTLSYLPIAELEKDILSNEPALYFLKSKESVLSKGENRDDISPLKGHSDNIILAQESKNSIILFAPENNSENNKESHTPQTIPDENIFDYVYLHEDSPQIQNNFQTVPLLERGDLAYHIHPMSPSPLYDNIRVMSDIPKVVPQENSLSPSLNFFLKSPENNLVKDIISSKIIDNIDRVEIGDISTKLRAGSSNHTDDMVNIIDKNTITQSYNKIDDTPKAKIIDIININQENHTTQNISHFNISDKMYVHEDSPQVRNNLQTVPVFKMGDLPSQDKPMPVSVLYENIIMSDTPKIPIKEHSLSASLNFSLKSPENNLVKDIISWDTADIIQTDNHIDTKTNIFNDRDISNKIDDVENVGKISEIDTAKLISQPVFLENEKTIYDDDNVIVPAMALTAKDDTLLHIPFEKDIVLDASFISHLPVDKEGVKEGRRDILPVTSKDDMVFYKENTIENIIPPLASSFMGSEVPILCDKSSVILKEILSSVEKGEDIIALPVDFISPKEILLKNSLSPDSVLPMKQNDILLSDKNISSLKDNIFFTLPSDFASSKTISQENMSIIFSPLDMSLQKEIFIEDSTTQQKDILLTDENIILSTDDILSGLRPDIIFQKKIIKEDISHNSFVPEDNNILLPPVSPPDNTQLSLEDIPDAPREDKETASKESLEIKDLKEDNPLSDNDVENIIIPFIPLQADIPQKLPVMFESFDNKDILQEKNSQFLDNDMNLPLFFPKEFISGGKESFEQDLMIKTDNLSENIAKEQKNLSVDITDMGLPAFPEVLNDESPLVNFKSDIIVPQDILHNDTVIKSENSLTQGESFKRDGLIGDFQDSSLFKNEDLVKAEFFKKDNSFSDVKNSDIILQNDENIASQDILLQDKNLENVEVFKRDISLVDSKDNLLFQNNDTLSPDILLQDKNQIKNERVFTHIENTFLPKNNDVMIGTDNKEKDFSLNNLISQNDTMVVTDKIFSIPEKAGDVFSNPLNIMNIPASQSQETKDNMISAHIPLEKGITLHVTHFKDKPEQIGINLEPAGLGKAELIIENHDNMVTATVRSDKIEVLDLIKKESSSLERHLSNNGLNLAGGSLRFEQGGGQGNHHNHPHSPVPQTTPPSQLPLDNILSHHDVPQTVYQKLAGITLQGGMDMRL